MAWGSSWAGGSDVQGQRLPGAEQWRRRRGEERGSIRFGQERNVSVTGIRRRPQGRSGRMCIIFFTNQNSPNGNRAGSTSFVIAEERNQFER
jgi:hypothetical protein